MKNDDIYTLILAALPHSAEDSETYIWAHDYDILVPTEAQASAIAELLETLDCGVVVTGYYDPEEDARHNTVDEFTGYWYVRVD